MSGRAFLGGRVRLFAGDMLAILPSLPENSEDRIGSRHPTIKPLDLMQYLVRLVTPPGGLVLDPFAGTGTTGEAACLTDDEQIALWRTVRAAVDVPLIAGSGTNDTRHAAELTLRARDVTVVCANPDLVVHVGKELIYCAGAVAQAYEARGGRVLQAGKPFAPIYERALSFARKIRGTSVPRERILAIGDAMRTDIAGAVDFGVDALFVTRGIHRDELHDGAGIDLVAYRQFFEDNPRPPMAAIPELVW